MSPCARNISSFEATCEKSITLLSSGFCFGARFKAHQNFAELNVKSEPFSAPPRESSPRLKRGKSRRYIMTGMDRNSRGRDSNSCLADHFREAGRNSRRRAIVRNPPRADPKPHRSWCQRKVRPTGAVRKTRRHRYRNRLNGWTIITGIRKIRESRRQSSVREDGSPSPVLRIARRRRKCAQRADQRTNQAAERKLDSRAGMQSTGREGEKIHCWSTAEDERSFQKARKSAAVISACDAITGATGRLRTGSLSKHRGELPLLQPKSPNRDNRRRCIFLRQGTNKRESWQTCATASIHTVALFIAGRILVSGSRRMVVAMAFANDEQVRATRPLDGQST